MVFRCFDTRIVCYQYRNLQLYVIYTISSTYKTYKLTTYKNEFNSHLLFIADNNNIFIIVQLYYNFYIFLF